MITIRSKYLLQKREDNPRLYDRQYIFHRDQYNNTPKESKDHVNTHRKCLMRLHNWYKSRSHNLYVPFPKTLNNIQYLTRRKLGLKSKIQACHSCTVGVTVTSFYSITKSNEAIALQYTLKFFKGKAIEDKIKWYEFQMRRGFWSNIGC